MGKQAKAIAVTMGDPAGVGPEVVLKAFLDDRVWLEAAPVVYGDLARLAALVERYALPLELRRIHTLAEARGAFPTLEIIDFENVPADFPYGVISAEAGRAALDYIEAATKAALSGEVAALVTAPVSKEAIRKAGSSFPGHTDLLAAMAGTSRYAMTLVGGELRAIFVTAHVPYADVPSEVTRSSVLQTIELAAEALAALGEAKGSIAVLGLNPHAGEGGFLGGEEEEEILPAILEAKQRGINCHGPIPADTAFYRMSNGEFQMAVAMYHDQGHAPLKLVAFDTGVNWTVGLPFVRTSPDHGTAFDIAGKGKARAESMKSAYALAKRLAADRRP